MPAMMKMFVRNIHSMANIVYSCLPVANSSDADDTDIVIQVRNVPQPRKKPVVKRSYP